MKKMTLIVLLLLAFALMITACNKDTPTSSTTTAEPIDPNEVVALEFSGMQTTFAFGEEFNYENLNVMTRLQNGKRKMVSPDSYVVSWAGYNSMKPGTYEVTVQILDTELVQSYEIKVLPADKIKVLMIGNSYADDTINYGYEVAKGLGIPEENILIADIYIAGCSIDTHWSKAQSNAAAYKFRIDGEGDFVTQEGWTMEAAIKYADWDFITFQQNSGNSGLTGTYSNLQNLMDYVYDVATDEENNENANPNVKFVWHQTWAYAQTGETPDAFASYGKNQMTMYNMILSCLQNHVLTKKDFVAIIPNGTAIQNGRTSILGDNFSRDKSNHLTLGAGRYMASMNLVTVLTGRDIDDLTWQPSDGGFCNALTEEEIAACKESVKNALANPLEITTSKNPLVILTLPDLFEGEGTEESPYLIQDADDMWALSNYTKGSSFTDTNVYFKLTADIDLSAKNWQPICASADTGWVGTPNTFNGNFDGDGHTITFVGSYTGDTWAKGLFSGIGGYVHDLTIRGSITSEKGRIGSLASVASAGAVIKNVTSHVNITSGNNQIGGIIGYIQENNVVLENCKNYGNITGAKLVGGILGGGYKSVSFTNCENHGNITATTTQAGGITGEKFDVMTVTNCTNTGTITAGGIAATADAGAADNYAGYLYGIVN